MALDNPDYAVQMPSIVPTCTWEDVKQFRQYQQQLLRIRKSLLGQMYLGETFEKKYGPDMTSRLLSTNNIDMTLEMYEEMSFMHSQLQPLPRILT